MRVMILFFIGTSLLFAHKLNVFLQQEGGTVYVNAYFASGALCKSCKVEIINKNEELIQEGVTSQKGEFKTFASDSLLTVAVDAGSGHMVKRSIEIHNTEKKAEFNQELEALKKENEQLKRDIALLKDKNRFSDIFKMLFALCIIAGIFFALKRVKR